VSPFPTVQGLGRGQLYGVARAQDFGRAKAEKRHATERQRGKSVSQKRENAKVKLHGNGSQSGVYQQLNRTTSE
jgi:hypothetical protein